VRIVIVRVVGIVAKIARAEAEVADVADVETGLEVEAWRLAAGYR
jgi:hypothetical protein